MKGFAGLLAGAALCVLCIAALAEYGVIDKGTWPKSWPAQLEPLRKQARTLEGPMAPNLHYAISFSNRDEFKAAWPHILKVKTKGAPVFLLRAPNFFLGEGHKAGVVVHCPPASQSYVPAPEAPIPGVTNPRERWMNATYIDVVVDDDIITFNRRSLPAGTPVIDERSKDTKGK